MLTDLILDGVIPERTEAVVTCARSTTWGELREEARQAVIALATLKRRRVGLVFPPSASSYAALAALGRLETDVFLLDSRLQADEARRISERLRMGALVGPPVNEKFAEWERQELPNEEKWSGSHTITILTSGSTGEPKAARHTWDSLAKPVRKSGNDHSAPRWLLTYRPSLYAGLQVMIQCFTDSGTLIAPDYGMEPQAIVQFMLDSGVQYVSATPSYWRRLLMFGDLQLLRKVPLIQITLGGEVVDQAILDNLRRQFPKARLVHIYATTELGRCFAVSDGKAGFPASYLEGPLTDGTELQVKEGEILVRSRNSMRMYDPLSSQQNLSMDWVPTGDLVETRDQRVYFTGRRTEMINVGGNKVHPIEVERVIRDITGVADVRVFGKSSSIAGELVACEIVTSPGQKQESVKEDVIRTCRAKLANHQQPRLVRFVDRIDLSVSGKTLRGRGS
jgi:acyl-CoA synthetase (AMP-forming)/AMP-acid ligase II